MRAGGYPFLEAIRPKVCKADIDFMAFSGFTCSSGGFYLMKLIDSGLTFGWGGGPEGCVADLITFELGVRWHLCAFFG